MRAIWNLLSLDSLAVILRRPAKPALEGCTARAVALRGSRLRRSHLRVTEIGLAPIYYLIACGLIGEPVPPVMISGGPQKKNS
jgi:hypothetical protein